MIACDPGWNGSAFAWFWVGGLVRIDLPTPLADQRSRLNLGPLAHYWGSLVVEMPERVHATGDGKTGSTVPSLIKTVRAAQHAITLAGVCGIAAETVSPNDWKGSQKKPPHHAAIWQALEPSERAVFAQAAGETESEIEVYIRAACVALATGRKPAYSKGWTHALDAVGLGLWKLGRIDRAGNRLRGPG